MTWSDPSRTSATPSETSWAIIEAIPAMPITIPQMIIEIRVGRPG